jgi:hypothetical protein
MRRALAVRIRFPDIKALARTLGVPGRADFRRRPIYYRIGGREIILIYRIISPRADIFFPRREIRGLSPIALRFAGI